MAKGDMNGTTSNGAPLAPKMDQYSVMHKIMDNLGQGAAGMAPSPDMQMPNPNINMMPNNGGTMGGRFTGGMGLPRVNNMEPVGAIAPSNPLDVLRRNMNGTRTFGG